MWKKPIDINLWCRYCVKRGSSHTQTKIFIFDLQEYNHLWKFTAGRKLHWFIHWLCLEALWSSMTVSLCRCCFRMPEQKNQWQHQQQETTVQSSLVIDAGACGDALVKCHQNLAFAHYCDRWWVWWAVVAWAPLGLFTPLITLAAGNWHHTFHKFVFYSHIWPVALQDFNCHPHP